MDAAADMTDAAEGSEVVDAIVEGRFELRRGSEVLAIATYRPLGSSVVVAHVETDPAHRGRGHATTLMDGIIQILQADGRAIVPNCSFAASYMRDHPELDHLRA